MVRKPRKKTQQPLLLKLVRWNRDRRSGRRLPQKRAPVSDSRWIDRGQGGTACRKNERACQRRAWRRRPLSPPPAPPRRHFRTLSTCVPRPPAASVVTAAPVASAGHPSAPLPNALDLRAPSLYLNRELSWLEFNRRVLDEAVDARHPLLERVKFLAIFSSQPGRVLHDPGLGPEGPDRRGRDRRARRRHDPGRAAWRKFAPAPCRCFSSSGVTSTTRSCRRWTPQASTSCTTRSSVRRNRIGCVPTSRPRCCPC